MKTAVIILVVLMLLAVAQVTAIRWTKTTGDVQRKLTVNAGPQQFTIRAVRRDKGTREIDAIVSHFQIMCA